MFFTQEIFCVTFKKAQEKTECPHSCSKLYNLQVDQKVMRCDCSNDGKTHMSKIQNWLVKNVISQFKLDFGKKKKKKVLSY